MRLFVAALALVPILGSAAPQANFQPLAYLADHCWKGSFPGGKTTDEHCFSWVYGGQFLRDTHTVHTDGKADALGESIYFWDEGAKRLQYLYIESDGGHSTGDVSVEQDVLVFPETALVEHGEKQVYRSRWQHNAPNSYDVLTEFLIKGSWVTGFKVHMERRAAD